MRVVYTIGHSNRSIEDFVALLREHDISAIADVRSQPFSKLYPHFTRGQLDAALELERIRYIFLGKELGARSDDPSCYVNGRVQYRRLAETSVFRLGLDRIEAGLSRDYRIALLCAEKDPLQCHRGILISPCLHARGLEVRHIISPGVWENHAQSVERLLVELSMGSMNLFKTASEQIDMAYDIQEQKIAFQRSEENMPES